MTTTATPVADAIKQRLTPALDTLETLEKNARRARRAVARGRYATEDAMTGAALGLRRRPLRSLALAAGTGALAGCIMGFVLGRRGGRTAADDGYGPWPE